MYALFFLVIQILPGMSDILGTLPSINPRVQQPCLQFTYWSVVFMEQTVQGSQVSTHGAATRACSVCFRAFRVPTCASKFYSSDILHVAPFFLQFASSVFLCMSKNVVRKKKLIPLSLPWSFFLLITDILANCVKSGWPTLHAVIFSFLYSRRELLWRPRYVTLVKNSTNLRLNPCYFLISTNEFTHSSWVSKRCRGFLVIHKCLNADRKLSFFKVTKVSEEGSTPKSEKQKLEIYFHSPNIAVRILSSLIILKTLSRGEICESVPGLGWVTHAKPGGVICT